MLDCVVALHILVAAEQKWILDMTLAISWSVCGRSQICLLINGVAL